MTRSVTHSNAVATVLIDVYAGEKNKIKTNFVHIIIYINAAKNISIINNRRNVTYNNYVFI